MDEIERIRAARSSGEVIGGSRANFVGSVEMFATAFGLRSEPGTYHAVSAGEATALLESVLHRDMAYACEIVPQEIAADLAKDFMSRFPPGSTRFYTNGTYGVPRVDADSGPCWQPATDATFDTGVMALGGLLSACVWFTDED